MPVFEFTSPEGKKYAVKGPEGATQEQAFSILQQQLSAKPQEEPGKLASVGAGLGKGFGQVALNAQKYVGKGLEAVGADGAGQWLQQDAQQGLQKIEGELAPYKAANPLSAGAGEIGGNILATLPVGGALGGVANAAGATRLGTALASGGMRTGATVAPTLAGRAADMGIRMAGGAGTGYAAGKLVDEDAGTIGAVVGGLLPPVAAVAGKAGDVAANLIRPFTKGGQERIAGDVLRQFATNADEAAANMRSAAPVVPGSMPTAVMASGDEGLAGLSRTLQSADPRYAAELSSRAAAQNAARTSALEGVAGNTGKLALAKEARDAATGGMRETVLDAAGKLQARPVLDSIDRLLAKPDNAGKISQQALNEVRSRIAQFAPDGNIDARALYAIRKDINDTLSGKLQGEAGNLKFASGQLVEVKKIIDDAIDTASRQVQSSGRSLTTAGATAGPRPTWAGYLDEYTQRSIPINQMEKLDDVMRSISTGTVDKSGNAVLSAAKLNNLLRNQAPELQKTLAPEQLDLLRRLAADLNASQLAANSGKAVGSNTVQNLAGVNVLQNALGRKLGGSAPAQSVMGRMLQLPYGASNRMIQDKLGNALLDPQEAARLMATPEGNALIRLLSGGAAQIGYRAAPALSAQ